MRYQEKVEVFRKYMKTVVSESEKYGTSPEVTIYVILYGEYV